MIVRRTSFSAKKELLTRQNQLHAGSLKKTYWKYSSAGEDVLLNESDIW